MRASARFTDSTPSRRRRVMDMPVLTLTGFS
jgi:hypothetical protein